MREHGFGRSPRREADRGVGGDGDALASSFRLPGDRGARRHRGGHGRGEGRGGWRGGRPGGGRGRRGDVRAAILALLSERPMHGYEMLQELAERTHDLWRPSPGSLYPALQLLEDQGLVRSVTEDGRRRFELTDDGRAELAGRLEGPTPWEAMVRSADQGDMSLHGALRGVQMAIAQVAEAGTAQQKTHVERLLADLRRQVYLLLADPLEHDEA